MHLFTTILLFLFNICLADEPSNTPPSTQLTTPTLPSDGLKNPLPDLGSCDEYTDYYIYQCKPFTCTLPLAKNPGAYREMSNLGMQGNDCLHDITIRVRHKDFRQGDIRIHCKLSPEGRAEMANLFTRYKKGDLSAYTTRTLSPQLGKECH